MSLDVSKRDIPTQRWRTARITHLAQMTADVRLLRLEPTDGCDLLPFSAGSHIQLEIPAPAGARRNAYSLLNDPADHSCYEIAVCCRPSGRGGSRFLHEALQHGDTLRFMGPANLFPLVRPVRRHIMVAGGIGVTPFLAMMQDLATQGRAYELHWAVRSDDWMPWACRVQQRFGRSVHLYNSAAGIRLNPAHIVQGQPLGSHLYLCGPGHLLADTAQQATLWGWPAECVHTERFNAAEPGAAFHVQLGREGPHLAVEADESLLEALEHAGHGVPNMCRGGACGQCETVVLESEGVLEHRDHWLSTADRAAGHKIMPCVSRFRGTRLVLDV